MNKGCLSARCLPSPPQRLSMVPSVRVALLLLVLHGSGALQLRTGKRASARARGRKRELPRSEVARQGIAQVKVSATSAAALTATATLIASTIASASATATTAIATTASGHETGLRPDRVRQRLGG